MIKHTKEQLDKVDNLNFWIDTERLIKILGQDEYNRKYTPVIDDKIDAIKYCQAMQKRCIEHYEKQNK